MSAPATSGTLATSIDTLLDAMDRLPSQGNVALRVLWMADDPTTGLLDLARVVETDPVLVARLLHLANSAYYSPRTPIGTVERAITLLGFATVRTIATVVACGLGGAASVPDGFWSHAAAAANAAQLIAWRFGIPTGDAFTVGLLHDLGRGLLHVADGAQSLEIDRRLERARVGGQPATHDESGIDVTDTNVDRLQLEQRLFGINHADAAARVLTSWRFPSLMVEAIAQHHRSAEGAGSDMTRLLIAAESVTDLAFGRWNEPVDTEGGLALLSIEPERLDAIVQRVRTESGTLAAVLGR